MFSFLKSKAKVIYVIVAAAFLVTIFAFWGMDIDSRKMGSNVAFQVNGDDIPLKAFEDLVSRYLENYKGQEISEAVRRQARKQAADELIGMKLLEQTSKKMGIHVTKEELQGHVRMAFPSDELYNTYLQRAPAAWWQNLEESTERNIKVSRARAPFLDAVWISDSEWNKIMVDLYYEADVSHMLFFPSNEVSDSDVRDYYEKNKTQILEPTKIRVRQILIKVARDDADSEVQGARERAQKLLELGKAGKDFPALAKKFSESPDAEDGGDMGFFKSGDMLKEVEDAAFALNPGQISELVRTEYGWHIFKLEERIPAFIRPLTDDLKEELRPQAVTDTHWELAKARGQQVLDSVLKFPEQFATLTRLHSQASSAKKGGRLGWMPRLIFPAGYDPLPLIGEVTHGQAIDRDISRVAFGTPVGTVAPEIVKSSFGWHIIKVHDRRGISSTPPSDTDMGAVRQTYLRLIREESLQKWIQEERKKAKIEFKTVSEKDLS